MADTSGDDRALLRRHLDGDPAAFGELVRRHRDRLWRVALRTLGDPDDAADAVQDALLSAFRSAATYRGDAEVTTWLHRITVNACLDVVRRRKARPAVPLPDDAEDSATATAPDALSAREAASDVLAALRELPIDQAAAVVLVDIEGFPVAEVAEMLDVPVGTVKSRCARARAQLARLLGATEPGERGNHSPPAAVQSLPVQPTAPPAPEDQ